jgi:hypothetical protein
MRLAILDDYFGTKSIGSVINTDALNQDTSTRFGRCRAERRPRQRQRVGYTPVSRKCPDVQRTERREHLRGAKVFEVPKHMFDSYEPQHISDGADRPAG